MIKTLATLPTTEAVTGKKLFNMTMANNMRSMSDVTDGTTITIEKAVIFEKDGVKLLSILPQNEEIALVTSSSTFIRTFENMLGCLEDELTAIVKTSGKSRNNRTFIDCELA